MEFPMFRNQRMRPMDVPIRQPRAAPPKVVSIPVHFVSSDSTRSAAAPVQFVISDSARSAAVRRIQKVVRGFLVRKSIKKIAAIKKEADEIEKKYRERERVELIQKDVKERLKINEMLMGLLFRLDSIGGVDFGVRVFRKSVTKKVVMLQERLDEIVFAIEEDESKKSDKIVSRVREETINDMVDVALEFENKAGVEDNSTDSVVESELNSESQYIDRDENSKNVEEEEGTVEMEAAKEPVVASVPAVEDEKVDDEKEVLMEKIIEKNEMLIKMVMSLCERNKMQTQMLNSLSKRVDSLEKKQRSRSKKRRQACPKVFYDDA